MSPRRPSDHDTEARLDRLERRRATPVAQLERRREQRGSTAVATNASGNFWLAYPQAFAADPIVIVQFAGPNNIRGGYISLYETGFDRRTGISGAVFHAPNDAGLGNYYVAYLRDTWFRMNWHAIEP